MVYQNPRVLSEEKLDELENGGKTKKSTKKIRESIGLNFTSFSEIRVFSLRLMLRLGAEFIYYPVPLVSVIEESIGDRPYHYECAGRLQELHLRPAHHQRAGDPHVPGQDRHPPT